MPGVLHLLPVPLLAGDPQASLPRGTIDVTLGLRHFLAENARSARAHLKAVGHAGPISELVIEEIGHHPDPARLDAWLSGLRDGPAGPGHDIGLLSEAGCPAIADPGATLVERAQALGITVRPWPGPCSPVLALMASGIVSQRFRFHGYLPQDAEELARRLRGVEQDAAAGEAQVFIETPYRNERLLESLLRLCRPSTRLCVAVDLTGAEERVLTLDIARWRELPAAARPALARRPAVFVLGGPPDRGGRKA